MPERPMAAVPGSQFAPFLGRNTRAPLLRPGLPSVLQSLPAEVRRDRGGPGGVARYHHAQPRRIPRIGGSTRFVRKLRL